MSAAGTRARAAVDSRMRSLARQRTSHPGATTRESSARHRYWPLDGRATPPPRRRRSENQPLDAPCRHAAPRTRPPASMPSRRLSSQRRRCARRVAFALRTPRRSCASRPAAREPCGMVAHPLLPYTTNRYSTALLLHLRTSLAVSATHVHPSDGGDTFRPRAIDTALRLAARDDTRNTRPWPPAVGRIYS